MFNTYITEPLFNLLFFIYALIPGHDFGLAVIVFTLLVRLALWPLVTKQLHSQRAMQKLAPEVAKVKKKAKGDRQKETQMLMELYKEKGTNPFASLLPLFVQIPIFIALFFVLQDSIKAGEVARLAYEPIRNLDAIAALISNKVTLSATLFGLIDLTKPSLVLALLAGGAQYYQTKQLTPKQHEMDDTAKMMANMGKIFPIITVVISMTLPAALALYWAVTSLVAILQQHLVLHRDAEEMKEMA
ncbi:MAG TPA: YidC/Oxa1 family membrane protein insertase [Candidatus Dormibacteraeota bacterium]|nr:YidC/Oxa1 family membrane protein insertase [Candidatus Dormibacteraeota bacterium]